MANWEKWDKMMRNYGIKRLSRQKERKVKTAAVEPKKESPKQLTLPNT